MKHNQGFSLVELMVAVGIFSVTATMTVGAFVFINSSWRTARVKEQAKSDLQFALDKMGTEIAFGSSFPTNCENGCSTFQFATKPRPDVARTTVEYKLDTAAGGGTIARGELQTLPPCAIVPLASQCFSPLTSQRVRIDNLQFFVENLTEDRHPLVTLVVKGVLAPGTSNAEPFSVSTSATPRSAQVPGSLPPTDISNPVITITNPTSNDSMSTASPAIGLGGGASDNTSVVSVQWQNSATAQTGNAVLSPSGGGPSVTWSTASISLMPGAVNTITVIATDSSGNIGTDTLTVTSTAGLAAPVITNVSPFCGTTPRLRIGYQQPPGLGVTAYYLYRCQGSGCMPVSLVQIDTTPQDPSYDAGLTEGVLYRYRARAYSSASNIFSPYSNIRERTAVAFSCTPAPGPAPGPAPAPTSSFTLTASPNYIEVSVTGNPATWSTVSSESQIRVVPSGGFSGTVNLSFDSISPSIPHDRRKHNFSKTTLSSGEYGTGSRFTMQVKNNVLPATYQVTLRGTSGGKSATVTVWFNVRSAAGSEE